MKLEKIYSFIFKKNFKDKDFHLKQQKIWSLNLTRKSFTNTNIQKLKTLKKSKCNQKTEKLFLINISISYLSAMI